MGGMRATIPPSSASEGEDEEMGDADGMDGTIGMEIMNGVNDDKEEGRVFKEEEGEDDEL